MATFVSSSRVCALALMLALAPLCQAESTRSHGSGTLQASARLGFQIVIPGSLRVALAGDGNGGHSLHGRLLSSRGALTVTGQGDGATRSLPVAQSEQRRGEALFSAPLEAGTYTIASP